jgi:hypothetical protein
LGLGESGLASVAQVTFDDSASTVENLRGAGVAVVEARVGVTIPKAERLLASLGARWVNATLDEDAGLVSNGRELRLLVAEDADLSKAVDAAAQAIVTSAPDFYERHPTIDAFVAGHRDAGDEDEFNGEVLPAAYAADGRGDLALQLLREYRAEYRDAEFDEFAARLEDFIQAGRSAPAPDEPVFADLTPASIVATTFADAAARVGSDDERSGRVKAVRGGGRRRRGPKLASWLFELVDVVRRGGVGGLLPSQARWCRVETTEEAAAAIEAAYATATTRIGDAAFVSALVRHPLEAHTKDEVLIGEQVVGRIDHTPDMPSHDVLARVVRSDPPVRYKLEVQLPKRGEESCNRNACC